MLLFALCCLTLPSFFAPIERLVVGTVCLVPRAIARWSGTPVQAAQPARLQRLAELRRDLQRRIREHDIAFASAVMPASWLPVECTVVAALERGGGGQPSELRLDRTYQELAGCSEFVTKGQALVGFLQRPGVGFTADDRPEDLARVLLLNHRAARSLVAAATLPEGGALRMVVGPAARADPAPLQVELWDDPYRAARLDRSGQVVHTLSVSGQRDEPPAGLWLGRTRIWGYEASPAGEALTIAVFLAPPIEPRALSHVVCWQTDGVPLVTPEAEPMRAVQRHAATIQELPGAATGRHLLATDVAVPDGAAVVQDGICIGTAHGLSFGQALVTSFAASRQRWSLLLLPDDPAARPCELIGEVLAAEHGVALVRWLGDTLSGEGERLPAGYLFTGSNGPHCPTGLLLGSARSHPFERDLLEVTVSVPFSGSAAELLVAGGGQ